MESRTMLSTAQLAAREQAKARAAQRVMDAAAAQRAAQPQTTGGGLTLPIIGEVTLAKLVIGGIVVGGAIVLVRKSR